MFFKAACRLHQATYRQRRGIAIEKLCVGTRDQSTLLIKTTSKNKSTGFNALSHCKTVPDHPVSSDAIVIGDGLVDASQDQVVWYLGRAPDAKAGNVFAKTYAKNQEKVAVLS